MQLDFDRQLRITAPVAAVWEEMDSLAAIMAKSPQLDTTAIAAGVRDTPFTAHLSWGPFHHDVVGTAELPECEPERSVTYTLTVPSLIAQWTGNMQLAAVGPDITTLDYSGRLDLNHRLAPRMRGMFQELAEEHVHTLTDRVKSRAERRRLAQDRLLG